MGSILSIDFEKSDSCHNSGHLYVSNGGQYEKYFLFGKRKVTIVLDYRPEFLEIGQNKSSGPWDTQVEVHFGDRVWHRVVPFANALTIKEFPKEQANWDSCLQ